MTRRPARAERLAPWALMAVLAAAWWGGARLVEWSGIRGMLPDTPRASARSDPAPERSPVPPAPVVRDPLPASVERAPDERQAAAPVSPGGTAVVTFQDITALRSRALSVPVEGIPASELVSSYRDEREGTRRHEAMDIAAPRGTPVLAVEDGRIAKLFNSARGGLTVYQFDPSESFAYYYAHLDRYAPGLAEGDRLHRGQTIGYVGTTGNAPPDAPHLHFAIFKLGPDHRWWEGTPIDPFVVWR
jgi:peptidoglycan LD-endopeptidase LytH